MQMNKPIGEEKLKIAFIDDEKLVRMLLINCVNWDLMGFKVIGDSPGEQDAIDMINELKPDVVFVDICMPIIDGIQMSGHIMKVLPECKIIIVTGHQEFEYAREGLKIGVFDYILKPINPKEIMDTALRAKEEIARKRKEHSDVEKLKSRMEENYPGMREQCLAGLVKHGYENIKTEALEYFGIHLDKPHIQMAAVSLEQREKHGYEKEIREAFQRVFPENKGVYAFALENVTLILSNNSEVDLYKALQSVRNELSLQCKCAVSCGISNTFDNLSAIPDACLQAKEALEFKIVCGKGKIVRYSNIINTSRKHDAPENSIEEMKFLIKSGLVKNAENAAVKAFDELMACYTPCAEILHAAGAKVLSACLAVMEECNISEAGLFGEGCASYEKILGLETLPQMKKHLRKYAGAIAKAVFEESGSCTHGMVEDIKTYLEENIADRGLSLSKVAGHFYLNHSYLSRMYKKETGNTFTGDIKRMRMERAAKLLGEKDLKVYELCEKVGIEDPHYLSILFKKYTGMTISDFKGKLKSQQV